MLKHLTESREFEHRLQAQVKQKHFSEALTLSFSTLLLIPHTYVDIYICCERARLHSQSILYRGYTTT